MQAYYFIFFFELLYFYKNGFEWLRKFQEFTVKNRIQKSRIGYHLTVARELCPCSI